jgi:hypothetical protein
VWILEFFGVRLSGISFENERKKGGRGLGRGQVEDSLKWGGQRERTVRKDIGERWTGGDNGQRTQRALTYAYPA